MLPFILQLFNLGSNFHSRKTAWMIDEIRTPPKHCPYFFGEVFFLARKIWKYFFWEVFFLATRYIKVALWLRFWWCIHGCWCLEILTPWLPNLLSASILVKVTVSSSNKLEFQRFPRFLWWQAMCAYTLFLVIATIPLLFYKGAWPKKIQRVFNHFDFKARYFFRILKINGMLDFEAYRNARQKKQYWMEANEPPLPPLITFLFVVSNSCLLSAYCMQLSRFCLATTPC